LISPLQWPAVLRRGEIRMQGVSLVIPAQAAIQRPWLLRFAGTGRFRRGE
jgi:hypothetical protein